MLVCIQKFKRKKIGQWILSSFTSKYPISYFILTNGTHVLMGTIKSANNILEIIGKHMTEPLHTQK